MFWLYRRADHVFDSGPFDAPPAHDDAVLGVVELFDPHISPRTNRVTDDGATYRLATPDEIAAYDADARQALFTEYSRSPEKIADYLLLLKYTSPPGTWDGLTAAERIALAEQRAAEWVQLRLTMP